MEEKRKNYIKYIGKLVFSLMLVASVFIFQNAARAEEYLLEKTEKTIFVRDEIDITDYFSEKEIKEVKYSISSSSPNVSCVELSQTGKVEAVSAGTAIINITYILEEETQVRMESFTVNVLSASETISYYGSLVAIKALEVYSPDEYTYSFSNDSVVMDKEGGNLRIQGFKDCDVYVERDGKKILVAKVTITAPVFEIGNQIARAIGTGVYSLNLTNYIAIGEEVPIEWNTENAKIAAASENGITPVAVGTTTVSALITAKNGDTVTLTAAYTVTDPKISATVYAIAVGVSKSITVTGTCDYSTYIGESNTSYCAYFTEKKKLYGNFKGTTNLSYIVDGKTFTLKVVVTNPKSSSTFFRMYKGQKKLISLSGLNKTYSSVTYTSANKKVATVTKKGAVKAVKIGVTKIKTVADGKTITIRIEISSKKAYKAAKKEVAVSKRKTKYSQARRMSKGYYDCSSLVSRVYRQYGVYFGKKSGWSPTAAAIGQWCTRNKKVIAKKGIATTKLVPGDLIFYSYTKNGRYRNISHIEMYVGNGKSVSASSSYNKVVHYAYKKSCVVLVARPTK